MENATIAPECVICGKYVLYFLAKQRSTLVSAMHLIAHQIYSKTAQYYRGAYNTSSPAIDWGKILQSLSAATTP